MTVQEIAYEMYRDDHHDGKVWSDLTDLFQAIYIDAAQELLVDEC